MGLFFGQVEVRRRRTVRGDVLFRHAGSDADCGVRGGRQAGLAYDLLSIGV